MRKMCFALLACAWHSASAEATGLILPMELAGETVDLIDTAGSRVLMGASPQIVDGRLELNASNRLYVAPHSSRVQASAVQVNQAANCSVVKNDLAIETATSDLIVKILDDLQEDRKFLDELNSMKIEASRNCLNARLKRLPDAEDICAFKTEIFTTIKEMGEAILPQEQLVLDLQDRTYNRLEQYGSQEGGLVVANVNLYDSVEIENVARANPAYDVRVVPMNEIVFLFNPGAEGLPSEFGRRTSLGYFLDGESSTNASMTGSSQAVNKLKTGAATAIAVVLSRFGACEPKLVRNGKFHYSWDGYGFVNGEASFNKWSVYEKLEKTSKKGGFFTTKVVHELHEDMKSEESFKFAVYGDQLSSPEEMKEKLRERLLTRILAMMAEPVASSDGKATLTLPQSGQNGAETAADGLSKCPHTYCQVATWSLKTLNAIFKKDVAREDVRRAWDYVAKEVWSYTTVSRQEDSSSVLIEWEL